MLWEDIKGKRFKSFVKAKNYSGKSHLSYMNKLIIGRRYIDLTTHDWSSLINSQIVNVKELRDFSDKESMHKAR
ncbi:hypothetical protein [Limosilactobacillus vaginalis]|uniref:hypothetical protein n=1 Tax=Limosilactobacillus vaginalis TaxID=1633 RepID=UPI0024B92DCA|nr:hypothetical protein [Limosilactobacillus vaginalis]